MSSSIVIFSATRIKEELQMAMKAHGKTVTIKITIAAFLMAVNIVLSSFGVPVPGGHLYLNDVVICLAALLLDPVYAFAVGGIGAFLGDLLFYPAPMFVSLVTHGLQAVVISLIAHKTFKEKPALSAVIAVSLGAIIMVAGYSLGRAYIYSTPEYAVIKLPFQILQASVGAIAGTILCFPCDIRKLYLKLTGQGAD